MITIKELEHIATFAKTITVSLATFAVTVMEDPDEAARVRFIPSTDCTLLAQGIYGSIGACKVVVDTQVPDGEIRIK